MRTEAERIFLEDVRDKKNISHSASHKRTHCGKGGTVRFPSDKLTKKELEKMNGECEVYRLNEPMKWAEFIAMPKEHQITYIKKLREKFNVPDARIARMLCVAQASFSLYVRNLGLGVGKRSSHTIWDKDGWYLFTQGVEAGEVKEVRPEEITHFDSVAEEILTNDDDHCDETISTEDAAFICDQTNYTETKGSDEQQSIASVPFEEIEPVPVFEECHVDKPLIPITPCSGTMSFEGKFEDVLKALSVMIGSGNGKIQIAWDVA